jgi:DNA-binding transcriptional LysR family regulator
MLSSSNALFVFEAAASSGSFTGAAEALNVTQPAVSRMLGQLEAYLGVRLFQRGRRGAVLTEEGEVLFRRVKHGFGIIETGLKEVERLKGKKDTVTISVSSAFTTHWMVPRMRRFQNEFPDIELRFHMTSGSLRGPVEHVDFGMRYVEPEAVVSPEEFVSHEVMLPVCSPSYMLPTEPDDYDDVDTIIQLTDNPCDWLELHPDVLRRGKAQIRKLTFSDYAVVMQAAMAGQGIAFGWLTVVCSALRSGALLPASATLTRGSRSCVLAAAPDQKLSNSAIAIREWIIAEQRRDILALDRKYPDMRFVELAYERAEAERIH